ncbi:MAG TPA: hypothetical protein VHT03_08900 [Rhizomicrobium sp.]|jgi:hypothetical protein|nr:hypothetical protein [Rhizomicrobium sp.]
MSKKTAILCGVAAAAMIGTTALAQSGYDNRYGNGPPESTPGEMQQTDQLNQQEMNNAASGNTEQAQYQGQYQDQQRQYNDQMQRYQAQQQRYQYERERYNARLAAYDLAQYEWSYPAPLAYHYGEGYGLRPLYLIAEPSTQLWRAPVEGPGGHWVGRVRNVEIAPDGRPSRVEIALNRRVSVWVRPGDLRFDPDERILYTDLTREALWDMPGATIVSAPL